MMTGNEVPDKLRAFSIFAKGEIKQKVSNAKCVIYTRVSSKEQTKGMSLETQRKDCELYATRNKIPIMGSFGGTYESAKTDERKEFNRMLTFVKKSKEKISIIIVYSVDRFSRSGANAIYIADQLKKQGIVVFAVTQPTDASTPSGRFQQNIQFIFSEYDNQLRREKCMAGVKEKLLAGIWCTSVPFGYDIVRSEGQPKRIVLNAKGKLIKYAFELKAMGMSNEDVRSHLAGKGLKLSNQRVSDMLRNPFYCGLVVHKALEGRILEGIQEKAVSKEVFLKVNGILAKKHKSGYTMEPENEEIPLKRFLKCEQCGQFLRAYKAYKNQQYYYKCNTKGCCCNKRADELHKTFAEMLDQYVLNIENEGIRYVISQQIIATYNQLTEEGELQRSHIDNELEEVTKRLERLEERYVMEEITKAMFEKYAGKLQEEQQELEVSLGKTGSRVSNLENCVQKAINLSSKLATVWHLSDYKGKQELQFLLFPDGIYYNRKTEGCRTPKINEVFSYISSLQRTLGQKESGNSNTKLDVPAWVENTGIEPVTSCMPCKRSTK
jgi:site-specific DNA recombinase